MKRIAFVTDREHPEISTRLHDRDDGWAALLQKEGFMVEGISWNDETVDWTTFDIVVVRSTHDYSFHVMEFQKWIKRLRDSNVNLFNPPDISLWNIHKSYLLDLKRKNIHIPDSVYVYRDHHDRGVVNLADLMLEKCFSSVVIKPCIAVASYEAHLVSVKNAGKFQAKFEDLSSSMDIIVQEYIEEITSNGEWGLIYLNKKYSHAILKHPAPGDFRAFFLCGGTVAAAEPPMSVRRFCDEVMAAIESPLLFSRVDVVQRNDESVVLMELELLDSAMYFDMDTSGKAEQLAADAVLEFLPYSQSADRNS